jgi:hypothetical protein
MTSAPTSAHGGGASREYAGGGGHSLVVFASVVLTLLGSFNLLDDIAAISRSHVFVANAQTMASPKRVIPWHWRSYRSSVLFRQVHCPSAVDSASWKGGARPQFALGG